MNFLWDIALCAEEQGWKEKELFFRQAKEYSPFFEQSFSCVNERQMESGTVELNLLYRFADIFQEILAPETVGLEEKEYEEFCDYFVDAALHTILFTDLRHGLSKRDIYIRKILAELFDGTYWKGAVKNFRQIEHKKQSRLAALLLIQMETGSSLIIFRRAVLVLYPDAMLYQMKNERKKLLLYLSCPKTTAAEQMMQFAQDMFLPIGFDLRIFWQYHFGIIGIEDTMKLDEMALY
ncbi:MAG: hypothetical protein HDQ96_16235 [Lachnospiraceae bacterium]|nr:hypothetical protein [Lachnospiraceae bacterium]